MIRSTPQETSACCRRGRLMPPALRTPCPTVPPGCRSHDPGPDGPCLGFRGRARAAAGYIVVGATRPGTHKARTSRVRARSAHEGGGQRYYSLDPESAPSSPSRPMKAL